MARIVLNTFGSLGDLHPFLAIALELRQRGHDPLLATSEIYRTKIHAAGIPFAPVRPDIGDILNDGDLIRKLWDPSHGAEILLREVLLPRLVESVDDLMAASREADLLITHSVSYAGPIVAEAARKPWLSTALQPMVFFSAFDPPVIGPAQWLRHFYGWGRWPFSLAFKLARVQTRPWIEPIFTLRRSLGLSTAGNPIFEGQFSPLGTLGLFSRHLAKPQPDWPPNVTVTGFVFYDQLAAGFDKNPPELEVFLESGPPPVLFTLGSSAVLDPGTFFEESVSIAKHLNRRAVLLVGPQAEAGIQSNLPESVFTAAYAPYSAIMPRSAAVVHQGGIGTMAQTMRAGRPMFVVPWAYDQPDNAERASKLGIARTLNRKSYKTAVAARQLRKLLEDPTYSAKAKELQQSLEQENGALAACNVIEQALRNLH